LFYYSAVRRAEALRAVREQFKLTGDSIVFDLGVRLKHGVRTPGLNVPLEAAYADEIVWSVENTLPRRRVWPYSKRTAYNIVSRVFPAYPHYFLLSRITNFFLEGWTVAQVHSWTGLSLRRSLLTFLPWFLNLSWSWDVSELSLIFGYVTVESLYNAMRICFRLRFQNPAILRGECS